MCGTWKCNCLHASLKSQGAVMSIGNVFQSQHCMTIYYMYDETLEGSSCCEMLESVQTHSILVWKVGVDLATFVPIHDSKTACGDHSRHQISISTLSNHSLYCSWEIGSVKLIWNGWISLYTLNVDMNCNRDRRSRNFNHLWLKSGVVVMVVEDEFQS